MIYNPKLIQNKQQYQLLMLHAAKRAAISAVTEFFENLVRDNLCGAEVDEITISLKTTGHENNLTFPAASYEDFKRKLIVPSRF